MIRPSTIILPCSQRRATDLVAMDLALATSGHPRTSASDRTTSIRQAKPQLPWLPLRPGDTCLRIRGHIGQMGECLASKNAQQQLLHVGHQKSEASPEVKNSALIVSSAFKQRESRFTYKPLNDLVMLM